MTFTPYVQIKVDITHTTRPAGRGHQFQAYHTEQLSFDTFEEANAHIQSVYKNKRRCRMYQDDAHGLPQHIGYIYRDKYQDNGRTYYKEDWVAFYFSIITPHIL